MAQLAVAGGLGALGAGTAFYQAHKQKPFFLSRPEDLPGDKQREAQYAQLVARQQEASAFSPQLLARARGQAPSVAANEARIRQGQANRFAQSVAAGQSGPNRLAAARAAIDTNTQANLQNEQQLQQLRAQEIADAERNYANFVADQQRTAQQQTQIEQGDEHLLFGEQRAAEQFNIGQKEKARQVRNQATAGLFSFGGKLGGGVAGLFRK